MTNTRNAPRDIPWFGARKIARELAIEVEQLRTERDYLRGTLDKLGVLSQCELDQRRAALEQEIAEQHFRIERERRDAAVAVDSLTAQLSEVRKAVVVTEDLALLQEAGVYHYRHPLSDAVAYQKELEDIENQIKEMTRKDGGAVLATTNWTVNGSVAQGRTMVRDFSKLLRAFNAEADNLVRGLKPYKLNAAIERLRKVASTIEKLGKTMAIRISTPYEQLRVQELELTADFLQKQAEEKEAERLERERAANIRAGYVYVISNIGSFGERMVKVGMTWRLDPMDRIRELSDASVPFNFDVHALFFAKDAVGIETAMHERLADLRVNTVNRRREFFRATPLKVKTHLAELAGELLQFQDVPDALEYRQCIASQATEVVRLPHHTVSNRASASARLRASRARSTCSHPSRHRSRKTLRRLNEAAGAADATRGILPELCAVRTS